MLKRLFKALKKKREKKSASYYLGLPASRSGYSQHNYAFDGYCRNPIIYKCIRLIADSASNLDYDAYRQNTLLQRSKFSRLLNKPNSMQDRQAFLDQIIVQEKVYGNAYIMVTMLDGEVTGLHCLDTRSMQIQSSPECKYPVSYLYKSSPTEEIEFRVDQLTGEASYRGNLLLHLRNYNPCDPFRGLSPIESAAVAGDLYSHGLNWNLALFKNSAKPSGLLKTSSTLMDEQFMRVKEQFYNLFQGSGNAGSVPVLENGLEFQPMSLSPTDMDFLQTLRFARETIAGVYNVPLPLISNEQSSYNNMTEAKKALYYDAVIPTVQRILNLFNLHLSEYFHGEELEINYESIQVLGEDRNQVFDNLIDAVNAGILSADEARLELGY